MKSADLDRENGTTEQKKKKKKGQCEFPSLEMGRETQKHILVFQKTTK